MKAIHPTLSSDAATSIGRPAGPPAPEFDRMKDHLLKALENVGVEKDDRATILDAMKSKVEDARSPEAVRDAITSVLEEHGVDVKAFEESMEAIRPRRNAEAVRSPNARGLDPEVLASLASITGVGRELDQTA